MQNHQDKQSNVLQEVWWNWRELSPVTRVLAPLWLALLMAGLIVGSALWVQRLLSLAQVGAWALALLALFGLNLLLVRRAGESEAH